MKFFTQISPKFTRKALKEEEGPYAVFAVAKVEGGDGYAATTRASDTGETGRIGLPGGKVEPGESPVDALVRECAEEGWQIEGVASEPAHVAIVDNRPVWWYVAGKAVMLDDYKEKGRITPIVKTILELAESGYGNEWLTGSERKEWDRADAIRRLLEEDEALRINRQAALPKFDDIEKQLAPLPDGWEKKYAEERLAEWRRQFEDGWNPHVGGVMDHLPIYLDEYNKSTHDEVIRLIEALSIVVDGVRKIVQSPDVRYTVNPPPLRKPKPLPPLPNYTPDSTSQESSPTVYDGNGKRTASSNQPRILYHGTAKQAAGEAIAASGILAPGSETTGRGNMAPVGGKVYLTESLQTAIIYALGADMAGHDLPKSFMNRTGRYGYVFEVSLPDTRSIQPDEDMVGELISRKKAPQWLVDRFVQNVAPSRRERVMYGEWTYLAAVGKQLLRTMTDREKQEIVNLVKNFAHHGEISVTRGWKIDKEKAIYLVRDGSNFFEYAEEVPVSGR